MPASSDQIAFSLYATNEEQVRYTDEKHVKKIGQISLSPGDINHNLDFFELTIHFNRLNTKIEVLETLGVEIGDVVPVWIEANMGSNRVKVEEGLINIDDSISGKVPTSSPILVF